jgi:hypothetical protein
MSRHRLNHTYPTRGSGRVGRLTIAQDHQTRGRISAERDARHVRAVRIMVYGRILRAEHHVRILPQRGCI